MYTAFGIAESVRGFGVFDIGRLLVASIGVLLRELLAFNWKRTGGQTERKEYKTYKAVVVTPPNSMTEQEKRKRINKNNYLGI